jgi:hypothetical protein
VVSDEVVPDQCSDKTLLTHTQPEALFAYLIVHMVTHMYGRFYKSVLRCHRAKLQKLSKRSANNQQMFSKKGVKNPI